MSIVVTPNHFARPEQAIAEIKSDGLFYVEADIAPDDLAKSPHLHAYSVDIYLLEGVLELHESESGRTHRLEAGSKAVVPADTLHQEHTAAGFRAAIGLSVDPGSLENGPKTKASQALESSQLTSDPRVRGERSISSS